MSQQLRWGDDVPVSQADARGRLVDAAGRCIERFGLAKTTVEDVATEASVSRQTIYRYFANRDELLIQALIHELEHTAETGESDEDLIARIHTPEDAATEFVQQLVNAIQAIGDNPKLSGLLEQEGDSVRSSLSGASQLLFDYYEQATLPWITLGQRAGFINPDLDPAETSEWLLRVALSLMTTEGPVERDGAELRRYLLTYLTPVLVPPTTDSAEQWH